MSRNSCHFQSLMRPCARSEAMNLTLAYVCMRMHGSYACTKWQRSWRSCLATFRTSVTEIESCHISAPYCIDVFGACQHTINSPLPIFQPCSTQKQLWKPARQQLVFTHHTFACVCQVWHWAPYSQGSACAVAGGFRGDGRRRRLPWRPWTSSQWRPLSLPAWARCTTP